MRNNNEKNADNTQIPDFSQSMQPPPFFLWDYLKDCGKPIIMYGTGDGAEKILKIMELYGLKPACFTATGDFPMKPTFREYKVMDFEEVEKRFRNFVVLICFGTDKPDVLERLYKLEAAGISQGNYEVFAPDVPVACGEENPIIYTPDYVAEHAEELGAARNLLADDKSREVFDGWLAYRLSGKIGVLDAIADDRAEILSLFKFKQDEFYIDAGACKGDTVDEFIKAVGGTNAKFTKIITIEPDIRNHIAIRRKFYAYGSGLFTPLNAAAWDGDKPLDFESRSGRAGIIVSGQSGGGGNGLSKPRRSRIKQIDGVKIDTLCEGFKEEKPTYIKIDAEGAEARALEGARTVITKHRPKMLVSLYHRAEDMFELPLLISSFYPKYKFYLRKTRCLPGWEFQLAVTG